MSSSDYNTASTVICNSEGSRCVETDQWEFEGTFGDKIGDKNAFEGMWSHIVLSLMRVDENGENGGVREDENSGRMFTAD